MNEPEPTPPIAACPFCGSDNITPAPRRGFPVQSECQSCRAEGPAKLTSDEAVSAWNTRIAPATPPDVAACLPARIFLQWHGDGPSDEPDAGAVSDDDVTWSREKVFDGDVEYIAAPPAPPPDVADACRAALALADDNEREAANDWEMTDGMKARYRREAAALRLLARLAQG